MLLDAQRDECLEQFAVLVFSAERERISRELLRERARALARGTAADIAHERAYDPDRVDAAVFVKTRVLAGEQRIYEIRRDFAELHRHAVLALQARIDFAVHVENRRALGHLADLSDVECRSPKSVHGAD